MRSRSCWKGWLKKVMSLLIWATCFRARILRRMRTLCGNKFLRANNQLLSQYCRIATSVGSRTDSYNLTQRPCICWTFMFHFAKKPSSNYSHGNKRQSTVPPKMSSCPVWSCSSKPACSSNSHHKSSPTSTSNSTNSSPNSRSWTISFFQPYSEQSLSTSFQKTHMNMRKTFLPIPISVRLFR